MFKNFSCCLCFLYLYWDTSLEAWFLWQRRYFYKCFCDNSSYAFLNFGEIGEALSDRIETFPFWKLHKRGEFLARKTPALPRVFSRHGEKGGKLGVGAWEFSRQKTFRRCPTHTKKITLSIFQLWNHVRTNLPRKEQVKLFIFCYWELLCTTGIILQFTMRKNWCQNFVPLTNTGFGRALSNL